MPQNGDKTTSFAVFVASEKFTLGWEWAEIKERALYLGEHH
jgi:hypothetical protein